ncbi:MAG: F0F1 ATP synthase subunit alpha [Candidatus Daviesbacteria bacterium]|nr:F0F1 ATP synthase subunit alpha [Candidatus Daviesbacteria bacterium]
MEPSQPTNQTPTPPQPNQEVGYVKSSRGYIVRLEGLPSVHINDLVESDKGDKGLVNTLYGDDIEVLMLSEATIFPGEMFKRTGENLSITVGDYLLGRSINPLGVPIDGKGVLAKSEGKAIPLDRPARGIEAREFITEQLDTGITLIDHLIPLGKGQRELVLGDGHSGKMEFLIDLIVNQNASHTVCIYAAIGKPAATIKNLINTLVVNKAMPHTIVVASSSTEPAPLIFLTPMAALTVAEYFQSKGSDVLLILDDMGNHAKIYREIALLGGKSPGRESYPGDVFYQHARLLERAGKYNKTHGGGSITALPVVELSLNDFTGFIPTNLMSITDGHLLFKSNLYNKNQRPAIDISLSVSRVGRQTQKLVSSLLSKRVRQVLAEAAELETLSQFSSELPPETQLTLRRKGLIEEIIQQEDLISVSLPIQAILLGLVFTTFLKDQNEVFMQKNKQSLIKAFSTDPTLIQISQAALNLKSDDELIQALEKVAPKLKEICK